MATHSSILAWTEEPGRLQSTGVTMSQTPLEDLIEAEPKLSFKIDAFMYMINQFLKTL